MVLMAFVNKCRELYQIAFFQWRRKHSHPQFTKMDEIEELIEFRIDYTFKRYQLPSEESFADLTSNSLVTEESVVSLIGDKINSKIYSHLSR
jgi:hypothetical protein